MCSHYLPFDFELNMNNARGELRVGDLNDDAGRELAKLLHRHFVTPGSAAKDAKFATLGCTLQVLRLCSAQV